MKRIALYYFITLSIFTSQFWQSNLYAQSNFSNSKGSIGITYSGLGDNDAFYFQDIIGGGDYHRKGYYSLGITYLRPFTKSFYIETGVSYNIYKYKYSNASLGPDAPEPYLVRNAVIDIPVTVRWNFLNYFFLNGGLSVGIDTGKYDHLENQSGIGAMIGVGAKYDLRKIPLGLFINPYYKIQNLLPFSMEKHRLRTDESGFRFGIVYNFH